MTVQVRASGAVMVRFGPRFDASAVGRLRDALSTLTSWSKLTVDFSGVASCDPAALSHLARAMAGVSSGEVVLHGLAERDWEALTLLGAGSRA